MQTSALPSGDATITTESSIWNIRDGKYRRSARDRHRERARPIAAGADLNDDTWVAYREAWLETHPAAPGSWRVAFVPAHRDAGSAGVRSGIIVDATFDAPVTGRWDTSVETTRES